MSRLQNLLKARLAFRDAQSAVEASNEFAAPPSLGFPHRLFVPEHYEPKYDYPLVLWLHSDHSSEYELDAVMQSLSVRNYVAIAPRAHRVSKHNARLFRWGTQIADLAIAEDFVMDAIQEVSESVAIHPDRIFVAGFGTGGSVAQWLGLRHPHRFAGAISINGPFPKTKRALSHWKGARHVPVLFMQGADSETCSVDATIDTMQLAHAAGLNYRFVRFQGAATEDSEGLDSQHAPASGSLDVEMLRTANRFLMGLVTGSEIPLTATEPAAATLHAYGEN